MSAPLTPRQRAIRDLLLRSLATGERLLTSDEIAHRLGITSATARGHLLALKRKGYLLGPIT